MNRRIFIADALAAAAASTMPLRGYEPELTFKGVPIVWDHRLDELVGETPIGGSIMTWWSSNPVDDPFLMQPGTRHLQAALERAWRKCLEPGPDRLLVYDPKELTDG